MAGHSKWANIKHRKAAEDAKRGQIFTKLIRELTVLARQNPKPDENPALRAAVDRAYASNMSKDTIERAIARGSKQGDESALEALQYEGFGPNGVAILVEAATDNRTRTVAEVRHAFSKHGGTLGALGSVAYLFENKGMVILDRKGLDSDKAMSLALELGALDFEEEEDAFILWTEADLSYQKILDGLKASGAAILDSQIGYFAGVRIALSADHREQLERLVNSLEALDDVRHVYTNADFDE